MLGALFLGFVGPRAEHEVSSGPCARGHNSGCHAAVKSLLFVEAQAGSCVRLPPPGTYSGTSPKPGAARASAAKILQYSRLMFWILHPCG